MILGDELLGQDTLRELEGAFEPAILDFLIVEIEFFLVWVSLRSPLIVSMLPMVLISTSLGSMPGRDTRQMYFFASLINVRFDGRKKFKSFLGNEILLPDGLVKQHAVENLIEITTEIEKILEERITQN